MQIFSVLGTSSADEVSQTIKIKGTNREDRDDRDDVSGKNLLGYVEKKHKEIIEHFNVMMIQSIIRKWLSSKNVINKYR